VDVLIPGLKKDHVERKVGNLTIDAHNTMENLKPGFTDFTLKHTEKKFGLPVMDLTSTLEMKQILGRKKDKKDIKAIQNILSMPGVKPTTGGQYTQKDYELWDKWKKGGEKKKDLDPLLKQFEGQIHSRIGKFKGNVEVPDAAIEMAHKREAVKAFKEYDPTKGPLSPYLGLRLKKAGRFIDARKNVARITEPIYTKIGALNSVKSELREQLGYEPDDQTIHDHVIKTKHPKLSNVSLKDISRINKEQFKDLLVSGDEGSEFGAPNLIPREEEVVRLIVPQLTKEERSVHEYTFGLNGKPELKSGEIAKKIGMENSKVSKLRTSIFNKMKPYLVE